MFHQDPKDPNYTHIALPSLVTLDTGPPFHCQLCTKQYPHQAKLLFHYVANHRLRFCGECSVALPTEQLRMTHENQKHWPFECRKCYAEFFNVTMLDQHYSTVHSYHACDLCSQVLDPSKANQSYADHLRTQHDVANAVSADVLAQRTFVDIGGSASDEHTKPITKFHCRLCSKEKLFANFQGHFLNNHKLTMHKFLEMTDQFVASHPAVLLARLGAGVMAVADQPKKMRQRLSADVDELLAHFEMVRREEYQLPGGRADETVLDFDSSLVQCVASTDEDEDSDAGRSTESSRIISCFLCSATAVGRHNIGAHLRNVHGFQVKNFDNRCSVCRKTFSSRRALGNHYRVHHSAVDASMRKCPFCEEANTSRDEMRKHIREHVDRSSMPCGTDSLAFGCRFCPKAFWTIDSKNDHQMRLHSSEMTTNDYIMCGQCGETMSSKTNLRVHTADAHPCFTQINKVVYKCQLCLIAYANLDDCRAHMLLAHPHQLANYCHLDTCRAKLAAADQRSMDEHLRSVHPTLVRFKCKWCDASVASRHACAKHVRTRHPSLSGKLLH